MLLVDEVNSQPSLVDHRICCNKANKKEVGVYERIIKGVKIWMHVCEKHESEFSQDGRRIQS